MLSPSCENGALSRLSNTQPEPNASCVAHAVSRTLTTNHPSPAGARPAGVSCNWASVIAPPLVTPVVSLTPSFRSGGDDGIGQHLQRREPEWAGRRRPCGGLGRNHDVHLRPGPR